MQSRWDMRLSRVRRGGTMARSKLKAHTAENGTHQTPHVGRREPHKITLEIIKKNRVPVGDWEIQKAAPQSSEKEG